VITIFDLPLDKYGELSVTNKNIFCRGYTYSFPKSTKEVFNITGAWHSLNTLITRIY